MEEELQKRNTDCVYFLASPLTCKKGMECEYRHSDIARLNPRDCWYWLAGSCLNPTCAFRHPPLDVHSEVTSEPAPGSHQVPTPLNKTDVPCFFYFSGYCNKGDRCSFSHGSEDSSFPLKPTKATSAAPDAVPLDNKASAGSDMKSVQIETLPSQSETAPKAAALDIHIQCPEVLQKPLPNKVLKQSVSPQIPVPECEEAAAVRSVSLLPDPVEAMVQSSSRISIDESSDEEVDDHTEREERWESSPGFDVLVDGRSDNIGYQDNSDYAVALDSEGRELNSHYLGYDFEGQVKYNPKQSDAELLYDHGRYDSFDCLEYDCSTDYGQFVPRHSRERMLDPVLSRKRKLLPMQLAENGQACVDLRDHLRKRRGIDGLSVDYFSRRHKSSRLIGRTGDRPHRPSTGRLLRRRLASEVERSVGGSFSERGFFSSGVNRQSRSRQTDLLRSRQRFEEKRLYKRQRIASEISKRPAKAERSSQGSTSFSGPKTLAEIREQKRKSGGNSSDTINDSSRKMSADFQGPKPLRAILKEKGRLNSDIED